MTTDEDRDIWTLVALTSDTQGHLTFSSFSTTEKYVDRNRKHTHYNNLTMSSFAEYEKENSMLSAVTNAMPPALYSQFHQPAYDGDEFYGELVQEFYSQTYPSWLAELPETVQTYFLTRWMGAVLYRTDLLGSSLTVATALVLTAGADGITTTAAGSATFAYVYFTTTAIHEAR
jgi:hypothetical protein